VSSCKEPIKSAVSFVQLEARSERLRIFVGDDRETLPLFSGLRGDDRRIRAKRFRHARVMSR
jgi:hypothetical protein